MHGQPEHNIRSIATHFPGHGCMDDLRNEGSLNSQATLVIDVLSLFFEMLSMDCFHNQTFADVRLTGARIKSLYCTCYNYEIHAASWTHRRVGLRERVHDNDCHVSEVPGLHRGRHRTPNWPMSKVHLLDTDQELSL